MLSLTCKTVSEIKIEFKKYYYTVPRVDFLRNAKLDVIVTKTTINWCASGIGTKLHNKGWDGWGNLEPTPQSLKEEIKNDRWE